MTHNDAGSIDGGMRRARRAYEWGRLQSQTPWLLTVLPHLAIALHFSGKPVVTVLNAALLAGVMVFFGWRGKDLGRAVLPGLLGGTLAFALPLIACATGICSRTPPSPKLILLCGLAGLVSGTWLTVRALTSNGMRLEAIAAAGLVAGLTAALSCAIGGVTGILGMLLGLAAATTPALARARFRA